jgi:hypothetical protein
LYCPFQEETGKLKFACLSNDGVDEHMVWYNVYASLLTLLIFLLIFIYENNICITLLLVSGGRI